MSSPCKTCKKSNTLKEASIQTDDVPVTKRGRLTSPPPLRTSSPATGSVIFKIDQSKGDTDDLSEGFSSESDELLVDDIPYTRKSLGRDETVKLNYNLNREEVTENTHFRDQFFNVRNTPDPKRPVLQNYSKSKTPALKKKDIFGESYERMVKSFKCKDSVELRECFKQLVLIEKKSLQETLRKKLGNRKY